MKGGVSALLVLALVCPTVGAADGNACALPALRRACDAIERPPPDPPMPVVPVPSPGVPRLPSVPSLPGPGDPPLPGAPCSGEPRNVALVGGVEVETTCLDVLP